MRVVRQAHLPETPRGGPLGDALHAVRAANGRAGGTRRASTLRSRRASPHKNRARTMPRPMATRNKVVNRWPSQPSVRNTDRSTKCPIEDGGIGGIACAGLMPARAETGTKV